MDVESVVGAGSASSKRQRTQHTRQTIAYPRKRASKACQTCRLRKTKCNNERPACGFCQSLGATCVYEDTKDISTLDPASQMIVDRLDEILQKLDEKESWPVQRLERLLELRNIKPATSSDLISESFSNSDDKVRLATDQHAKSTLESNDDLNLDVNMMTPPCRTSPDAVLDWPIFKGQYKWGYLSDFLFSRGFMESKYPASNMQLSSGSVFASPSSIDEESVPKLVEIFLSRVHIKSPVLDVNIAREYARSVAQEGVRWTAPSCLVLIMSALGCIARPFGDLYNQKAPTDSALSSDVIHGPSLAIGKVYFEGACKRIATLEPSILATQCIYLCGVYEMYNIKPLHAWRWFSQASSTLFMYLKYQDAFTRQNQHTGPSSDAERLEASVYWSAYKSMCELRTELPLPASLLFEVEYPHVLPTPPSNFAATLGFESASNSLFGNPSESLSQLQNPETSAVKLQEQAWFFYLTDIILSRLGTRVLLNLFDTEHTGWDTSRIYQMIKAADEFERQLNDWFEGLPEPIQFDDFDIRPDHELRFTVQARALEIKAWLYRPFLYYAIHHQPPSDVVIRVNQLVRKAIDISIHWILLRPVRHRHHGSWYVGRLVLSSALSIIATVKAGIELESLNDWGDIVREAISAMEFWAKESPDFESGRDILKAFYAELVDQDASIEF